MSLNKDRDIFLIRLSLEFSDLGGQDGERSLF